ncbi:MAG: hypothetical protein ACOC6G_02210 [Thermoproteota archaeon]
MEKPPEKLGSFYLGAEYDLGSGELGNAVNYDARDLTTHGICVGMTGSGKTGLCIGLLEEAAIDKVPAVLIDPKGDITNLLLQFPDLSSDDFLPWVNPDDARRKDMTVEEYSKYVSNLWREGLAKWGIDKERIQLLADSCDFTIYTPGSEMGIPVNILSSFAAPDSGFDENVETVRDRIKGLVSAVLTLSGFDVDPVRSREAILLATIFEHYWRRNEDLDLESLIKAVQDPPFGKLGVFEIDSFFPEKDRFKLALALNSLVASPSFKSWLKGEPLEISRLLYTPQGKPRQAVIYIAHLSDRERMFFVTLLLEQLLAWVRSQSGTTSLRALLYFDEVFGFFPPVAEPPSKRPLMTLMKQARAFGLGVLLVTQNPVDLDYKGLTNAGTWFIGKLQTERDKDRVLEGLKGAITQSGGVQDKVDYDRLVSRLGSRVFLMHNVHEKIPRVFHTRWVMSYLRGPLTRPQIQKLMRQSRKKPLKPKEKKVPASITVSTPGYSLSPPILDPSVSQYFLTPTLELDDILKKKDYPEVKDAKLVYEPALLGVATIHFKNRKMIVDERVEKAHLLWPSDSPTMDWEGAEKVSVDDEQIDSTPVKESGNQPFYSNLTPQLADEQKIKDAAREYDDWLYHNSTLTVKVHPDLKVFQQPSETEREYLTRVRQAARERRDEEVDELEEKYRKKLDKLEKKMRRLEGDLSDDRAEYEARKREEMIGAGESVLNFFMGRRRTRDVTTIARKRRMTSKAKREVQETEEEISELEGDIEDLAKELEEATDEIVEKWDQAFDNIVDEKLKPRKRDINVKLVSLTWAPTWQLTIGHGKTIHKERIAAYL